MAKNLKVGERVSVDYEDGSDKFRGTVWKLMPHGNVMVHMDSGPVIYPVVHPDQCVRLVPRRKPREWEGEWREIPLWGDVAVSEMGKLTTPKRLVFVPSDSKGIATGRATLREVLKGKA